MSAASGFQTNGLDKDFLIKEFSEILNLEDKSKIFEFIQSGLRRGNDIYKKGGHVISKYRDVRYTLEYDNKRCLLEGDPNIPRKNTDIGLKDSRP